MSEIHDFAWRLRSSRDRVGLTQEHLAQTLNISLDTVGRWERGERQPRLGELLLLSNVLQTTVAYLAGETTTAIRDSAIVLRDQVRVPIYANITACCGPGVDNCVVDGEIERYIPMPRSDVGNGECYGIRVVGSSMELANIPEDSIAVVNRDMWPHNGAPCHVQYIKHGFPVDAIKFFYKKLDGTIILKAANGSGVPDVEFPPGEDSENDRVLVCGVVVSVVTIQKPRQGF